jgi:hypothetical protein
LNATSTNATSTPRTAAALRRCFIHIGTPKTGSTSLQAFLAANRAQLLDAGIFIPQSAGGGDPEAAGHHAIPSELLGEPPWPSGGLAAVGAELASTDAPVACISSENISLLYDRPEQLKRLRDVIVESGFTPVIVAYVRPQVSYATAVFALNVLNGYRTSFADFYAEVIATGRCAWNGGYGPQFDYTRLLDGFSAVFGPGSIVVRRFSSDAPDAGLLRSFTRVLLPDTPFARFDVPPKRANRTMTFPDVLRRLGTPNNFDQHVRFAPFTLPEILRFWLRFAPANRRLAAQYGTRLPVFEVRDLVRALPIRRTLALTRQYAQAQSALRSPELPSRPREPARP